MNVGGKKLFISHATADKSLIAVFLRFLKDGLGIYDDDVFCTSLSGTLKTGYDFIPQIKDQLHGCKKVIFLITENYLKSAFCLAELGATWAIGQSIYPIIIPPVKYSDLYQTPLPNIQAQDMSNVHFPSVFRDELIAASIATNTISTPQFLTAASEFTNNLNNCLSESSNVVKEDSSGFATATVVEHRIFTQNHRLEYHGYRVKEHIVIEGDSSKNRSHWLLHLAKSSRYLVPSSKIKFRIADIVEDTDGFNDGRVFIAPELWAVDIKL